MAFEQTLSCFNDASSNGYGEREVRPQNPSMKGLKMYRDSWLIQCRKEDITPE